MSEKIANHIKAVFFDHDDTLVDTFNSKVDQHKHIAREHYNKVLTEDDIKKHWGKPLHEFLCLLYGTDDFDEALKYTLKYREKFPKALFEITIPTLEHLKTSGKLIGVVTSTVRDNFEHDLALNQIPKELIDYSQTLEDTDFHKPDPRVFEPAIKWLLSKGVLPEEVVYVGDGLQDMQAALGAGFSFLGVQTGVISAEQFKQHGAISVSNLGELI